jgi:hypothetical protein
MPDSTQTGNITLITVHNTCTALIDARNKNTEADPVLSIPLSDNMDGNRLLMMELFNYICSQIGKSAYYV